MTSMRTAPFEPPQAIASSRANPHQRRITFDFLMDESRVLIRLACSTAPSLFAALGIVLTLAEGCARSVGPTAIGTLGPGTDTVAVMRLRPGVESSSCRRWILGIPVGGVDADDSVAALLTELLSQEPDATVLSEAEIRWEHLAAGIYERQCVTLRGVLGRTMRTITIPGDADVHGHHGHSH